MAAKDGLKRGALARPRPSRGRSPRPPGGHADVAHRRAGPANSANLLPALGRFGLPEPWNASAVIAMMVSAVATLETQLLQCTDPPEAAARP